MSMKLEQFMRGVLLKGLNSAKDGALSGNITFSGTNTHSGSESFSGAFVAKAGLTQGTITTIDAQNGTPTAAQLLGGIIKHNSKTGGGTVTFPTGAELSAVAGSAVGSMFRTLYYNYGNQTATLTTAASGTTVIGGTAAVTTGKHSMITFVCTAANTWDVYLTTLY